MKWPDIGFLHAVPHWGGSVDWDAPTEIPPGVATLCLNSRFRAESVATRFGRKHTMTFGSAGGVTGLDCLNVLVNNPGQIPVAFTDTGLLLQESPPGSGKLVPINPPVVLPTAAYMQTALAYNRIYMAFSDMRQGLIAPLVLDGPTGVLGPVGQNPIGGIWKPGTTYLVGDVVRTSANPNRWFRCITEGVAGPTEPTWPTLDGYATAANLTVPALANDPNGPSQWTEWTPWAGQYVPAPEPPVSIISIKGQQGFNGTIPAAQDVYVCFAYTNANGESVWTPPIVFVNTQANDLLEIFFQAQGDNPGPTVPPSFGAVGYGGPRMPQWLQSVLRQPDPSIQWPDLSTSVILDHLHVIIINTCLNCYVAAVPTGTAAPTTFYLYSANPSYAPVTVSSIPATGTTYVPRINPTAALTKIPFVGVTGPRYMAVERVDLNGSFVPIDPGSPLLVNFTSSVTASGTANVTFIQRVGGVVTCTVDELAGFAQGSEVVIAGVTDSSFDGSYALTGVSPNDWGGATLIWTQGGSDPDAASTGGTATTAGAASDFVIPTSIIATITRVNPTVTAIVNSLQGLTVGAQISVSGVSDASFDGTFVIATIVPNNGGGGTITWPQAIANSSGTGGSISPTGAGTGGNAPQPISFIVRNQYPASPGTVLAIVFNPTGQASQPPPGFVPGASIVVAGITSDASLNGSFIINNVESHPAPQGGYAVGWSQSGANSKSSSPAGTITLVSGAPLQQSVGNITAIARAGNVVTATLDSVVNFSLGAPVNVNGVTDASFDGTFEITSINVLTNQLQWAQQGNAGNSASGSVRQTGPGQQQPTPVAVLPPGGEFVAQDIATFSVQGSQQAGPFFYITTQDPATPFTAKILEIGAVNGTVTALLDSTSGLVAGDTIQISGTPNGWFDGVFVLAQVSGNTIEYAGQGPGTGYAGGAVALIPTLPTVQAGQNNPIAATSMTRTVAGLVSAQMEDVGNLAAGMRVAVTSVLDPTFSGQFVLLSVTQPSDATTSAGTVTWQSETLTAATVADGAMLGIPGQIVNFDDNALSNSENVTSQLTAIPPPPCVDVFYSENLDRMIYTKGSDSQHYFANIGDAANIDSSGGILSVAASNGAKTVCVREMISGEIISMKENAGYAIQPSALSPQQWKVERRWKNRGPVNAEAVGTGSDYLIIFVEFNGPYRYYRGELVWIGREKQGTWERVNWQAKQTIQVEVNEDNNTVHFLLPLDGATTPNKELVLNYFNGWEEPLRENIQAQVIPNRAGRRWTENDLTALSLKKVQRMLSPLIDSRINDAQLLFGRADQGVNTVFVDLDQPDTYSDDAPIQAPLEVDGGIVTSVNFNNVLKVGSLGTFSISGLVIATGDLIHGGTFADGATIVVTTPGFPLSFVGTLTGITWVLVNLAGGTHAYTLTALFSGPLGTGALVLLTANLGAGFWTGSAAIASFNMHYNTANADITASGTIEQLQTWAQVGIDWQYQPAFAASQTLDMIRWLKAKGRMLGSGLINFTPVTEDSTLLLPPITKLQKDATKPTKFQFGFKMPEDSEMVSFNINNGKQPGVWTQLQKLMWGGNEVFPGRPTE